MDIWERLEAHWYPKSNGFKPLRSTGAIQAELQEFERTRGVTLPADLREYFLRFNGIEEDDKLFCFWPLRRLSPLPATFKTTMLLQADKYFLFADFLIESHYYTVYLGGDPFFQNRVILPDHPRQSVVSANFTVFLEIYLADSPALYGTTRR